MSARARRVVRSTGAAVAVCVLVSAPAAAARHPDPIVSWNRVLLGILRTPGAQPATVQPTRSMAILHVAQYDAIAAIDGHSRQYRTHLSARRRSSERAAAITAARDVLVSLYPSSRPMLDAEQASMLAQVPSGVIKRRGEAVGARAARAILALRASDGAEAPPAPYATTGAPGDFAAVPPAFGPPAFTHWAAVKPWVLRSAAQFRPGPPPSLTSDTWASAYQEVQSLGSATSTTRSEDQTEQARFWAAPIQNYWNEIAQTAALRAHVTLAADARTFALLNLGLADGVIAFYDAKYHYRFWRPVTAIRAGDSDGNPATVADRAWTPLAATPADPSYPGAHSVVSAIAATVLEGAYGRRLRFSATSEALAGARRSFTSFADAATEAGLSRIYAGVHTRLDHEAGVSLGRDVGRFVIAHALRPVPR